MGQIILCLCFFIVISFSSSSYDIRSYYGHHSLDYFLPSKLLSGRLVPVEYHYGVDASYDNSTLYIALPHMHCVQSYSISTQMLQTIVGECGHSGNVLGSMSDALLNGVESVAYYRSPSASLQTTLSQQRVLLVANQSCALADNGCLLSEPYPSLTMANIRLDPDISLYTVQSQTQTEYLFIADTGNHCIKRVSMSSTVVEVVAGQCGISGFKDGPLGINLLNSPSNLGVSRAGVVYFFDKGNEYMRIIENSRVKTLLLGACKQYTHGRVVNGHQLRQMLCYQDWIEGTLSGVDHYFDETQLNICTDHSSQCTTTS